MPRILSVSEVRKHLYWAAGGPDAAGDGAPALALLGSLFHQIFAQLTGPDPRSNLVGPLQLADATLESWQRALSNHAYKAFVAPSLGAHQAALQTRTAEVMSFWAAVESLCGWLAAVLHEQRGGTESLEAMRARVFAAAEHDVSAELSDPAWPDTVLLQGRADAIVAQRGSTQRCLVELKLGRAAPEADLLQACLYHLLLGQSGPPASHLALIVFEPSRREHLFEAHRLVEAQAKLKALVWQLAGGDAPTPVAPAPRARDTALGPEATPAGESDRLAAIGHQLEHAFAEFGAPIVIAPAPLVGPAFVRFFAQPKRGVRARAVTTLGDSVWTRLGTSQPPQVAIIHGRLAIDVERPDRRSVEFADWRSALPARDPVGCSRFAVGVTVDGTLHLADLSRPESAHFLVAGTSGSGKTEWLRAAIASLLASNTAETLRLALIDPKRTGFGSLSGSRYLWQPVVYAEGIEDLLDGLVAEMDRRYDALAKAGADHLAEYNDKCHSTIPRIVCVCDEYADLLLADRKRRDAIETRIARLGAKARAAGIHLVFATQRPSRDIVKGVIDANFGARVALKVAKQIESRIMLDESGAETLLGRGDLLFKDIGSPVRLQGLFVTRDELEDLSA